MRSVVVVFALFMLNVAVTCGYCLTTVWGVGMLLSNVYNGVGIINSKIVIAVVATVLLYEISRVLADIAVAVGKEVN